MCKRIVQRATCSGRGKRKPFSPSPLRSTLPPVLPRSVLLGRVTKAESRRRDEGEEERGKGGKGQTKKEEEEKIEKGEGEVCSASTTE